MAISTLSDYEKALKEGQKDYRDCLTNGVYPYPLVLDEILMNAPSATQEPLGEVEVPLHLIKGTKTEGRKSAFSRHFYPLLDTKTEFAIKWMNLCKSQMEEGIRDPIKCYEFMGHFYVEEGNKRVSVMQYFGAGTIRGVVTRMVPPRRDAPEVRAYYEYMDFYRDSKVNFVIFNRPGGYQKLCRLVGIPMGTAWTEEQRQDFASRYYRFRRVYGRSRIEQVSTGDALLAYLTVYPYDELDSLKESELAGRLYKLRAELRVANKATEERVAVQMEPQQPAAAGAGAAAKRVLQKVLPPPRTRVAFLFEKNPETSAWTAAHEFGRSSVAESMAERIETVPFFDLSPGENDGKAISDAVKMGCEIIFTTTPRMLPATVKAAVEQPDVRFLNCSVNIPHPSIRTYYGRSFEGKFIMGAIAGALADHNRIGYVAQAPIYGVPAEINAFALGARMVNPRATVHLRWTCLPGIEQVNEEFRDMGIRVISHRDMRMPGYPPQQFGLYRLAKDGSYQNMASPFTDWGRYYQRILENLLAGGRRFESGQAVNYWWGVGSGVIDVLFSRELPQEVKRLAYVLKDAITRAMISPFDMKLTDRAGNVRHPGNGMMDPEDIITMDWLTGNVEGEIPKKEAILPMAMPLVERLGIYNLREEDPE